MEAPVALVQAVERIEVMEQEPAEVQRLAEALEVQLGWVLVLESEAQPLELEASQVLELAEALEVQPGWVLVLESEAQPLELEASRALELAEV